MGTAEETTHDTWLQIRLTVNGAEVQAVVPAGRRLAAFLRDDLGLTGTKVGCEVGVCGVCTVLVNDRPTSSCLTLAVQVDGADVRTVEGLAGTPEGRRLQEQFVVHGGFQCGYCTSGQLMAATAIIADAGDEAPDRDALAEQLHGYLCRCTGYYGIIRAIRASL